MSAALACAAHAPGCSTRARGTRTVPCAASHWPAGSVIWISGPFSDSFLAVGHMDNAPAAPKCIALSVTPHSPYCALTSLTTHFARSTYIFNRFNVLATRSWLQTKAKSSAASLNTTKLASIRPLALHHAASRASLMPSVATSCVSWPCKNGTASAPWTRKMPSTGASLALSSTRSGVGKEAEVVMGVILLQ